jgi:hypothetical protein
VEAHALFVTGTDVAEATSVAPFHGVQSADGSRGKVSATRLEVIQENVDPDELLPKYSKYLKNLISPPPKE